MTSFDLVSGMRDWGVPNLVAMGAPPQGGGAAWLQFVPFLLVLGIFYFVILMPMKKRQQKVQAFLAALKVDDRVITSGGIYGTIARLNDDTVQLQIANAVRIQIWTALIAVLVVRYLQFRSSFRWALSNLVALLRWNLFTYRNLWEWLNRPFDTPPEPAAQLELILDSSGAPG